MNGRTSVVNHSNHGEFAYRDGPWKIVFRNERVLHQSRGKDRIVELYNLRDDIAESHDLAEEKPDIVERMTRSLEQLIAAGTSRSGVQAANDTAVEFRRTQLVRWGVPAE